MSSLYDSRPNCLSPSHSLYTQCLRRYRDTREALSHLVNVGKYFCTFPVILFSHAHTHTHTRFSSHSSTLSLTLFEPMEVTSKIYLLKAKHLSDSFSTQCLRR